MTIEASGRKLKPPMQNCEPGYRRGLADAGGKKRSMRSEMSGWYRGVHVQKSRPLLFGDVIAIPAQAGIVYK